MSTGETSVERKAFSRSLDEAELLKLLLRYNNRKLRPGGPSSPATIARFDQKVRSHTARLRLAIKPSLCQDIHELTFQIASPALRPVNVKILEQAAKNKKVRTVAAVEWQDSSSH